MFSISGAGGNPGAEMFLVLIISASVTRAVPSEYGVAFWG
jgi:hypothetical protein